MSDLYFCSQMTWVKLAVSMQQVLSPLTIPIVQPLGQEQLAASLMCIDVICKIQLAIAAGYLLGLKCLADAFHEVFTYKC